MGFINAVLEEEVDYGFEGGVRYKTDTANLVNGFMDKDSAWEYGRHEFSASFANIDEDSRDYIIAVFHVCRGARHAFKFKDWNDYKIEDQIIQVVPGTGDKIQLYKTYEPFGPPYVTVRPIQALKFAIIEDANGDEVAGTYNLDTGEFTPSGLWGFDTYKIREAEFYVWVSFEDDYNPMTINSWRAHTANVTVVEQPMEFDATNVPPSWEE